MFELQCLALRKDAKMYKDRIEAILQQMEEVSIERDQVVRTRGVGVLVQETLEQWSKHFLVIYAQGNLAVLKDRTWDHLYKCSKVHLTQRKSLCRRRRLQSLCRAG